MMFDSLFGPDKDAKIDELKTEVEEKQEKIERIEKNLEKEKKRAKEAITEKQKTDKEVKNLENKLDSLKDKIRRLEKGKEKEEPEKKVKHFSKNQYSSFLDMMSTIKLDHEGLKTQYATEKEELKSYEESGKIHNIDSETGFVHLSDELEVFNYLIIPPFPIENSYNRGKKFNLEQLKQQLSDGPSLRVIDLHAGTSTVGFLKDGEFENFEKIKSNVKSKHSKGGFSQGRFERNRKKQIEEHVDKVIEKMGEFSESLDYTILAGNDRMTSMMEDKAHIEGSVLEKSLNLSDIKSSKREDYLKKIFGARLYIL